MLKISSGLLIALVAFCLLPAARADSIIGASFTVTSYFDNDPAQQFTFPDITSTRINAGVFSDWMLGSDPNTNLEFVPGTPNGNATRNLLEVNFSSSDNFQPADTITLSFQISPDLVFNPNFIALIEAIDVQVPSASVNGSVLTFTMTNLDQIQGNGGKVEFLFDAESGPEPSTFLLAGGGVLGLLYHARRRRRT